MDAFYDFDDDDNMVFSDDDGVDVIGLLEPRGEKVVPLPTDHAMTEPTEPTEVLPDASPGKSDEHIKLDAGSLDDMVDMETRLPEPVVTEGPLASPAAFSNVFFDFDTADAAPISSVEKPEPFQGQPVEDESPEPSNTPLVEGFSEEFLPFVDDDVTFPSAIEPFLPANLDTNELQLHVEDKRASVVLDDQTILLNEATPKDAFVEFICAQPNSHSLQLSLHIPLQPEDQSLLDVTYDKLHQLTNGLTPAALLELVKATKLFPYMVSLVQFEDAVQQHGKANPILTLRNFQDIVTSWADTNEPLASIVPERTHRLQALLNGLNHQLDLDILGRCKDEVHEQVWIKAAAKYDHSTTRTHSPAAPSPNLKAIITPKQTQAFVARMQSDLATRLEKEQMRAAQRQQALAMLDQAPDTAGISISHGSVRILQKNGWIAANADACIDRMLRAKKEQEDVNNQERERNLAVDARTGQRLFCPQVNKKEPARQKRQGGHVCDELYALAQQKALKAAWIQEQRKLAIDATVRRSVQMNSASKQRCEDRFERDFAAQMAALDSRESMPLQMDQMVHVMTWFGLLPLAPSKDGDLAAIQSEINTTDLRRWVRSVVLNDPPSRRSEIWKRCRRQYISRIQPTVAQRPTPTLGPKTPKKAALSSHYTLHGKAAEAEDPLSERHSRETVKLHELRLQLEDSATAECTFTPAIHSRCHRDTSKDIGHRLYDLAVEKRAKQVEQTSPLASPGVDDSDATSGGGLTAIDRLEAFYAVTAEQAPVAAFEKAVEGMRSGQREKARKAEKGSAAIATHLKVEAMRSADGRHTIPRPFGLHHHQKSNKAAVQAKKSRLLRQLGRATDPSDAFVNVHIAPALDHSIALSQVQDAKDVDDVIATMRAAYSLDSAQVAGLETALHDFAGLDFSHVN